MSKKIKEEVMNTVNVFIEITTGSSVKYELNKETGQLEVDRFLHTAMYYPFNYGFVPNTLAEDGDATDILVLSSMKVTPGVTLKVNIIGMLEMEDEAGIDTKLISVPDSKIDPVFGTLQSIEEVSEHRKNMIKHFFEHYKDLEKDKWVKVKNWLGAKEANNVIQADFNRAKNKK